MKIPFLDLKRQYQSIKEEVDRAVREVVESGRYIGGEKVENFEKNISEYIGVKHAIGVSSGTDALMLALMAIDIRPGDEVITSPFTFIATAEVVSLLGAKPVFIDIEEDTFNINVDLIEQKITERTKAIIPVHLFGQMANIDKVMDIAKSYNLYVIEDAAQAIGASIKMGDNYKYACDIGDMGCLSFFPSKNLGGFGDGGMVCTNNDELAEKLKMLREHGAKQKYYHTKLGINGRLDAIQAAVLDVKLKYLDKWTRKRIENAEFYNEHLNSNVKVPEVKVDGRHVYNQYSILTNSRDEFIDYLSERGVPTAVYYPIPLHLQEVFKYLGYKKGDFPVSEEVSKRIVSLPVFPELYPEEKEYVVETAINFFKGRR